jgi:hypothetical protein
MVSSPLKNNDFSGDPAAVQRMNGDPSNRSSSFNTSGSKATKR